jgi:hypothetical protein
MGVNPVQIPLGRGFVALVDACDAHLVEGLAWHALTPGRKRYAAHSCRDGIGGPVKKIYMHHLIAEAIRAPFRHPINGDALDCRRDNFGVLA